MNSSNTVAFFGLGRMGLPMASRLMAGGYPVVGFDPAPSSLDALEKAGGRPAASPADAVQGAAFVIAMLPDGKAVRAVVDAVLDYLRPGAILIDMSSSAPPGTRELSGLLAARGFGLVDAPVSGGVRRATDGSLAIMVGGEDETVSRVRPLLETMGSTLFRTGPIGSGHAMKALNNYVSAAGLTAACEALRIGEAFGLDPALMTDILNASTGRNNSTEVKLKPFVIPRSYGSGFSMAHMTKDLGIAADLANSLDLPLPFSRLCADLWRDALAALGPAADHTAIDAYVGGQADPA